MESYGNGGDDSVATSDGLLILPPTASHRTRGNGKKYDFDDRTPVTSPDPIASSTCMKEADFYWRNNQDDEANVGNSLLFSPPVVGNPSDAKMRHFLRKDEVNSDKENNSSSLGLINSDEMRGISGSLLGSVPVEIKSSENVGTEHGEDVEGAGEDGDVTQSDPRLDQNELDALDDELDDFDQQSGRILLSAADKLSRTDPGCSLDVVFSGGPVARYSSSAAELEFVTAPSEFGSDAQHLEGASFGSRNQASENSVLNKFSSFPTDPSEEMFRGCPGLDPLENPFDVTPRHSTSFASAADLSGEEWRAQEDLQKELLAEDFLDRGEAAQLEFLDREEIENKEKHRFIPDDMMEASLHDNSSWTGPSAVALPRPDWLSCSAVNSSKLSASAFFQRGSEVLGNISQENAQRPYWGTAVKSPVPVSTDSALQPQSSLVSGGGQKVAGSVIDDIGSDPDSDEGADDTIEGEDKEMSGLSGPVVSTPLAQDKSSSAERNCLVGIPLPAFSTLSLVEKHPDLHLLQGNDKTRLSHLEKFKTKKIPDAEQTGRESDALSLSAIQRIIADASIGANASALADVVLKSRKPPDEKIGTRRFRSDETLFRSTVGAKDAAPPESADLAESPALKNRSRSSSALFFQRDGVSVREQEWAGLPSSFTNRTKLESNKHRLMFGCIEVGQYAVQSAVLRNSSREILRLKLSLRHSGHGFQLTEDVRSGSWLLLHPEETYSLKVGFRPKACEQYSNKVMMEVASCSDKFSIPVLGLGGSAVLSLDHYDAKREGNYELWISGNKPSHQKQVVIRNRGLRSGFFKIAWNPLQFTQFTPASGVVIPGGSMAVTVTCRQLEECVNGTVFWGDEIQRQRLRSFEKNRRSQQINIGGMTFTEHFFGEQDNFNSDDFAQVSSSDCRLFVGSLRNIQIRLLIPPNGADATAFKSFTALNPDNTVMNGSVRPTPSRNMIATSAWVSQLQTPAREGPEIRNRRGSPPERDKSSSEPLSIQETKSSHVENGKVTVNPKVVKFSVTNVNGLDTVKVEFRNVAKVSNTIRLRVLSGPFSVRCTEYRIDPMKFVRIGVDFEPVAVGNFTGSLEVKVQNFNTIIVPLKGQGI